MTEEPTIPDPSRGEVRIKVLAAGTGFTDTMIRRGRYPEFKGPLPFTPGYEIVGVVEKIGSGVTAQLEGQMVADLCVVGGYAQYAIRPEGFLVPVPGGVDPTEAVCIPLAYLTAFQMLTRYRNLPRGALILVIGASGTVGTALLDLARHLGLEAIGTCSAANRPVVERFGATAIDYHAGDFVTSVARLTADRPGRRRSRYRLRCDRRRAFRPLVRVSRAGRVARWLRVANHGRRSRKPSCRGTWLGPTQVVGRIQLLSPRPSRRLLKHYVTPIDSRGGIQGRHGDAVPVVARRCPSSGRDRPTFRARGRKRGSRPNRQRRTWRQNRATALAL